MIVSIAPCSGRTLPYLQLRQPAALLSPWIGSSGRIERSADGALSCGMAKARTLKVKLQLFCGDEIAMGPGKADLLEAIEAAGSISAAARNMGMSYRRAWMLVDTLNRCWAEPVVETVAGGSHEKGARVSEFGKSLLGSYRALHDTIDASASAGFGSELAAQLRKTPRPGKHEPA